MLRNWILAALIAFVLAAPAAGTIDISKKVEAFDNARLKGPGAEARGTALSVGNLSLRFTSGKLFPILVDGKTEGVFFIGEGQFEYSSVDPFEAANFKTNVKRATRYTVEEGKLAGAISELIFWGAGYLDDLPDGPAGDSSREAQKRFRQFRDKREFDQTAVEVQVVHSLAEPPGRPFAIVELGADKKDLVYTFDTVFSQDESIFALDKVNLGTKFTKQLRQLFVLSRQPIGRNRLTLPPMAYRLVDVDANVVNPGGMDVRVEVRETFEILEPTRVLKLSLMSWRMVDLLQHDYRLKAVTGKDGSALPFVHREGHLIVQLPQPAESGDSVVLDFAMEGDILGRPGGDNYWILGPSGWLPEVRRVDANFHSYRVVIKVPKPFMAFSNGRTVKRWDEGNFACAEFRETQPIFLPVILAGKYKSFEQTNDGVTIQVHAYAQAKKQRMEKIANNLFALLEFYEKTLGDYPFSELKVIEINQLGWGQAPPGIIFITKEAFIPGQAARGWSIGINSRLAHELAHTWWGDISPWASDEDYWLCESTADYYAAVAMGILWRESEFDKEMDRWRDASRWVGDSGTILLANQLSTMAGLRDRQGLLYAKGPLVLHALRQEIGDNAFFTAFKTLLSNRRFQHITTQDAIAVINMASGKDYTDWIHRYIAGTEWPDQGKKKKKKKKK